MCAQGSSKTTNKAGPPPSAGGWNLTLGHGTIGFVRMSSLNTSNHWRTVKQPPALSAVFNRADCTHPSPSRETKGEGARAHRYAASVVALVFNGQYIFVPPSPGPAGSCVKE